VSGFILGKISSSKVIWPGRAGIEIWRRKCTKGKRKNFKTVQVSPT
jgi:hypothetical protein